MNDIFAMQMTDKGLNLLAKGIAKEVTIRFTRVASGDGYLPDDADPYKMAELIHYVRDFPLHSMDKEDTGIAVVRCIQSNQALSQEYWVREIGVFAEDPDEGEILYAYMNAGDRADFLPAEGGSVVVQFVLALITIISRAPRVEAVINGDLTFVTHYELNTRVEKLFADAAPILEFWTRTEGDGNILRPASKQAVMNCFGLQDYAALSRRVDVIEDIVAQLLLEAELKDMYPDYTHWILEDFRIPNMVDLFSCKVVTVISGSNSIDCEQTQGLVPGCHYTLTDGRNSEVVAALTINVENGVHRVITATPVKHTYRPGRTMLLRTSALVTADGAEGSQPPKIAAWTPDTTWKGIAANDIFEVGLDTSIGNANAFSITGDILLTSDGFVTLGVE